MSRETIEEALRQRISKGFEGIAITVFHQGKAVGVDICDDMTKALLDIDFMDDGGGVKFNNFVQQYLSPAFERLKMELEEL